MQAWITHQYDWNLWPETNATDWSYVHTRRWSNAYTRPGEDDIIFPIRYYDPYSAYAAEGSLELPPGHKPKEGRFIDNVREDCRPSRRVLDRIARDLHQLAADGVSSVWWDHAIQCFPEVAEHLPTLFDLSILNFADDMPGSSEAKTLPVARFFDVLVHSMWIWDCESGKTVPTLYREHGLEDCRFIPVGPTPSVAGTCTDAWFERKLGFMRQWGRGDSREWSVLSWIGGAGVSRRRTALLDQINKRLQEDLGSLRTVLHGAFMRDGRWNGTVEEVYGRSFFGVNVQESSLFNQRLFDLWLSGVVQLVHDPHGELAHFGFVENEHYLAFDGTYEGLLRVVRNGTLDEELVDLVVRARSRAREFLAERSWTSTYRDIYYDWRMP